MPYGTNETMMQKLFDNYGQKHDCKSFMQKTIGELMPLKRNSL
jgi:hypothetical protein